MSTFDGHIHEFPDIQVDYFRNTAATARCRPLACFLSHVHSDHLAGLDTLRSPFVYCSAATRALVLQLQTYANRVNYAKGILEARKRTYKDLEHVLKPLPLDTPTTIELAPGNRIQVTLFDANHCPGSVMFLFDNGDKAALYTGDTRLEPWFVNSLVRHPSLAVFVCGLRSLDTVYLDTTFLQRDVVFQTKAEGLHELLRAVAAYPADTVFYLRAWTFGYEEVWAALAQVLASEVHVDSYTMSLYEALAVKDTDKVKDKDKVKDVAGHHHLDPVAPRLVGFQCANTAHAGCLQTGNETTARIHSCDKGAGYCAGVRDAAVVWIRPVVCRHPRGGDMPEVGAGGGGGDLVEEHIAMPAKSEPMAKSEHNNDDAHAARSITFPYSRHSSYQEQCDLLDKLRPRDVWPCTVHQDEWVSEMLTIRDLFGAYCSGDAFRHDAEMAKWPKRHSTTQDDEVQDSQMTVHSEDWTDMFPPPAPATPDATKLPRRSSPDLPYYYYHSTILQGVGDIEQAEEVELEPGHSQTSVVLAHEQRAASQQAVVHNAVGGSSWMPIGLLSTSDNHTEPDVDLGLERWRPPS